jgi:hypothetical protein
MCIHFTVQQNTGICMGECFGILYYHSPFAQNHTKSHPLFYGDLSPRINKRPIGSLTHFWSSFGTISPPAGVPYLEQEGGYSWPIHWSLFFPSSSLPYLAIPSIFPHHF